MISPLKIILLACAVCAGFASEIRAAESTNDLPKVFCASPQALVAAKALIAAHDVSIQPAFDQLLAEANRALKTKPLSVMDKKRTPPSGDKHDYMSQAPYYWRDTNSPGEKYIRRDGERNPEAAEDSDAGHFGAVCSNSHALALAFYFSGDEKYAAKATEIIRVWFLNPDTRMNPNLNFGQGVPGETEGRAAGLIGARGLVDLADAMGLLASSKSWTTADQQGMTAWVEKYLDWLTTSKIGRGEGAADNNHGTFYDTQVIALAMFAGKNDLARQYLLEAQTKRIAKQIQPDGRMPRELGRTLSFNYSLFNLRALIDLASLGQNAGVDLWQYQTADGRSILKALEFVAKYADPKQKWPFQQIHAPSRNGLADLLLRAAPQYPQSDLVGDLKFLDAKELEANQARLIFVTAK